MRTAFRSRGQFVHTVCLARSFSSRRVDCPFCNQSLANFARSSSFLASSLFHGCMVDLDRAPSNQAIDSLVSPDDFPPSPQIYPLCCTRVGGPPEFEPLDDRRMEWSPKHPCTHGATSWVPQWICRSCGASTSLLDIPPLDAASCSLCSTSSAVVFDRPSGRTVRFCVPCQRVVPHDSSVVNTVVSSPPSSVDPPDWFSHGPLSCFDSLHGWGVLALLPIDLFGSHPCRIQPWNSSLLHWQSRASSSQAFPLLAPMLPTSSKRTPPISSPSTEQPAAIARTLLPRNS